MSAQRRENRRQLNSTGYTGRLGQLWLAFLAWFARAIASVGTAPPHPTDLLGSEWLATKSLQLDYRDIQLVRFIQVVHQDVRPRLRSAWPRGAVDGVNLGRPAANRSSLPHTLVLPGLVRLPLALP